MNEERDKAMILILGFFRNRMAVMSKVQVDKVKELTSTHEIAVSELVDRYIQLVYETS